jgi:hypothetical protein
VARSSDLVAYAFSGVRRDTALRRIRRLFDAGYLEVHAGDRAEENRYALGPKGREWIREQSGRVRPVPRGSLAHHLAIVRAWIDLALGIHARQGMTLVTVRPDWELREANENVPWSVVPDLLLAIRLEGPPPRDLLLAVEVDCGTEPLGILRRKVEAYEQKWTSGAGGQGAFCLAVVFAGAGVRRREHVLRLAEAEWSRDLVSWAVAEGPGDALKALEQSVVSPLTDSPCSKGTIPAASASIATGGTDGGGGL